MERIVEQTLLYDFYGELLNEHQRGVYEDAVFNDLSLSEIADEYGISRQGVHDLIKRVSNTLEGYESKLHLVEKFMDTKVYICRFRAFKIPLCPISDILLSQGIFFGFKEFMFYNILNFINLIPISLLPSFIPA